MRSFAAIAAEAAWNPAVIEVLGQDDREVRDTLLAAILQGQAQGIVDADRDVRASVFLSIALLDGLDQPAEAAAGFAEGQRQAGETMMMGGALRTVAIVNGTLAAALGLGLRLWVAGVVVWIVGHAAAAYAARKDPAFMEVLMRHFRHQGHCQRGEAVF